MDPDVYYDYVAIIKSPDARTFKISASGATEAGAIPNDNSIGDDYTVEDLVPEKQGVSEKKEVPIINDL